MSDGVPLAQEPMESRHGPLETYMATDVSQKGRAYLPPGCAAVGHLDSASLEVSLIYIY